MPVIALIVLVLSLFFAPFIYKKFGNKGPLCLFLAVCLFCEIFLFNFEYFRSAAYEPITSYRVTCSENVEQNGGSFALRDPESFIEINNIIGEVENIYIKTNTSKHLIRFFAADSANENRYYAGDRTISRYSEQASYIKTNFTGKATQIRLYIPDISNRIVTLSDIKLNVRRPMFFSFLRPAICLFFLCFIYYLIIRKNLWKQLFHPKNKTQNTVTVTVALTLAVLFFAIPFMNPGFISPPWAHHYQYNELADAFLKGQLHLDKEVPEILQEMDNPYDRNARREVFSSAGLSEPWDTAYFGGKYYVYFGVLPVFLFYLPAKLLGFDFPNFMAVVIFSWVLIAGVFLLYRQLMKMYFKRIPYLLYLTLSVTTVITGGVIYIIKRPDFYSIPIIGALAFTVMGIYFWLAGAEKDKLSVSKMFIGSVFMASVIALRPNLVFFSCIAFLIYWDSVFTHRELLSIHSRVSNEKYRGIKNTVLFCAPYIVIGGLVMIYNFLRFNSPFDFGAAYNLTTSDMTQRGYAIDRLGLGVFEYLISPPVISATFPYLTSSLPSTSYIGFTSSEGMFGGIFATYPVLWSIFAMHKTRTQKPFKYVVFLFITSFIICLLDIQAGGILPRYICDFAVFFVMAAVIVLFMLYEQYPSLSTKFAAWALLCMIIFDGLLLFAGGSSTIQSMNKSLYMHLYSIFAFYL